MQDNGKKMDMHSFLVKLLLPIYVVISLSLVISHAKAVEHPKPRLTRSRDNRHIHVSVRPREIDFYPGDILSIACKARGGNKIEEIPFISFYRQMDYTHIPLSSGDPGVLVEPAIATDHNEHKVKKLLTIGKYVWYTLEWGENLFYCKATDMNGHSSTAHFFVIKRWHDNYNTSRGRKRRFLLYKLRRASAGRQSAQQAGGTQTSQSR